MAVRMNPATIKKLIANPARNELGEVKKDLADNWETHATLFARVVNCRPGEFIAGGEVEGEVTTIFETRATTATGSIQSGMRLLSGGQTYTILAAHVSGERECRIKCKL